nr:hypothetical protein B0A51_11810 [Rachicladosporium sp. CCFEE 5018]
MAQALINALVNVIADSGSDNLDFLKHLKPEEAAVITFDDEAEGGAGFGAAEDGAGFGAAEGGAGFGAAEGGAGFGAAEDGAGTESCEEYKLKAAEAGWGGQDIPPLTDANREEYKAKAAEAGWGGKIPADYEMYNQRGGGDFANYTPQPMAEEFNAKAQEAGWVVKIPVDYEMYNRHGASVRRWCGGDYKALEMQMNKTVGPKALAPARTSNHRWCVAPAMPELEQHHFGGEFCIRRGGNYTHSRCR